MTFAVAVGQRNGVAQALTPGHIMSLFCSIPEQHQGWQRQPMMLRVFGHSIERVLSFPKHPHSSEAELHCRRNAASTAMVRLEDGNKRAPEIGPETSYLLLSKECDWGNRYPQRKVKSIPF